MSKFQTASERQAAQDALDAQEMLSSQLMQAWTNNTPLVFKGTLSLIAPASDGDIVLGSCALAQPITGVVPDNFRCQGNWDQFLSSISEIELPIQQACMQGCQQIVGTTTSLLANTLLIQGASVPTIKTKRLAVTRPVGLMTVFGTSSIPVLRTLASVECGINGHEYLKTREVESQICEVISCCSVRKGLNLINRCQGRTGDNIIPLTTAHRVVKTTGRRIKAQSTSIVTLEQHLELSCLAADAARANFEAGKAFDSISEAYGAGYNVNEASGKAAEAVEAAHKAKEACDKVIESLRSNCEQAQIDQELSHAIELVEVAFKTLAEAKSACMSLVQTDSDTTKHHDAANLDGDTYAECPC